MCVSPISCEILLEAMAAGTRTRSGTVVGVEAVGVAAFHGGPVAVCMFMRFRGVMF